MSTATLDTDTAGPTTYTCEKCCGCIQHYYTHSLINLHQLHFATPTNTFEQALTFSYVFVFIFILALADNGVGEYQFKTVFLPLVVFTFNYSGIKASMQQAASVKIDTE